MLELIHLECTYGSRPNPTYNGYIQIFKLESQWVILFRVSGLGHWANITPTTAQVCDKILYVTLENNGKCSQSPHKVYTSVTLYTEGLLVILIYIHIPIHLTYNYRQSTWSFCNFFCFQNYNFTKNIYSKFGRKFVFRYLCGAWKFACALNDIVLV